MSSPGVGPASQRLGRYHLAEPLGGGPTGEVFRAKVYGVAGFERQFAVKRFHAEFVRDPAIAETVASAARVYGSLEHPRIARLHEYGVTGGHTFTATELIQGMDLSRLLSLLGAQSAPLPEGATAALLSQIARTIGYAHGRGICHLGLCPTNVLITPNGEARITDFGFLPPRLPAVPAEDSSLRARMPYLSPEQLASESTSAATDVFQLGAIGQEMFMLEPAFSGRDSASIAQRISDAESAPLVLAKPLAKVIERCLARSPFERFPDARAFADALDAATRDLGLAGGLPDVAQAVRNATEMQQSMASAEMSGALSFPLPAPPRAESQLGQSGRQASEGLPATTVRDPSQGLITGPPRGASAGTSPSDPAASQTAAGAGGNRPREVKRPPVPPGLQGRKIGAPRSSPTVQAPATIGRRMPLAKAAMEGAAEELDEDMPTRIRERNKGFIQPTPLGLATINAPSSLIPSAEPGAADNADGTLSESSATDAETDPQAPPQGSSRRAARQADSLIEASTEDARSDSVGESGETAADESDGPPTRVPTPPPPLPFADLSVDAIEISAAELELLPSASDPGQPIPPVSPGASDRVTPPKAPASATPRPPLVGRNRPGGLPMTISDASLDEQPEIRASNTWDAIAAIPHDAASSRGESKSGVHPLPSLVRNQSASESDGKPVEPDRGGSGLAVRIAIGVLVLAVIGGGGYFAYDRFLSGKSSSEGERIALTSSDASARAPTGIDAGRASPPRQTVDAGANATAIDAGGGVSADAGARVSIDASARTPIDTTPTDPPIQTPTDDGRLTIRSKPRRAKVYLDGSPMGTTTVRTEATKDRHRLVVIRPGYKLYTAEIDGGGKVQVTLEEATDLDGPAGIKVRCARKNRYYVFVDGLHTGQLCPTERLGVALGEHTVEIYDPVTETRRQFPVNVDNTRRSLRVRVD